MRSKLFFPDISEMQPEGASNEDLLATLLSSGSSENFSNKAFEMSRDLLRKFGSWRLLLATPVEDLAEVDGMDPDKLARLGAVLEILTRLLPRGHVPSLLGSAKAANLFAWLGNEEQEVVAAAFLHANNEVIFTREIFRGTVRHVFAEPREILREGLKANAAGFILAHNHVSNALIPSVEDLRFTTRLEWAAETVGIALLDHLIIGTEGRYFSFAEAKLLRKASFRPWNRRSAR